MAATPSLPMKALRLLPLAGLAALLTAGAAATQEGGGILLSFGIEQRFSWADNAGLVIPSEGDSFRADTRLSFGFVSETPRDRLTLNVSGALRGEDRTGGGFDFGLDSPAADLDYTRSGATSSFTTTAFLRETNLDDGLILSEGEGGESPVLVFEDGTARTKGGRLAYNWGEGTPFGGTVRTSLTDTDYIGTTDPDLVGNRTTTAGVTLRFRVNEVTEASVNIDHRRYDETGAAPVEDSTTVSVGLNRTLPRGSLSGNIAATRDEDGTRTSFSFGRRIELPNGSLSADLGLTEAANGGTNLTGALAWRQELVRGGLSARLSRAVTNDTNNDETLITALSLGLTQELTPRMGLNMGASWTRREDVATDSVTDSASLDAALGYALTEDWNLNVGASHRLKDEDGVGRADSNSVFLSVGRRFEWRP